MKYKTLYEYVTSGMQSVDKDSNYITLCKFIGYLDNSISIFKQLHWNYEGESFKEIHELFGDIVYDFNTYQDRIAERLRALNLPVFFKALDIDVEFQSNYVTTSINVLLELGTIAYDLIGLMENDLVTQNILIELKELLDKKVYLLSSFKIE